MAHNSAKPEVNHIQIVKCTTTYHRHDLCEVWLESINKSCSRTARSTIQRMSVNLAFLEMTGPSVEANIFIMTADKC